MTSAPSRSSSLLPLSSAVCLWDRIPTTIKGKILKETDIPTRFINKQPLSEDDIKQHAHAIWIAVINTYSWELDLTPLPKDKFPTILNGLGQVTSREVYHQLQKQRPDLDVLKQLQPSTDNDEVWKFLYIRHFKPDMVRELCQHQQSTIPKLLIHIPMRQFWQEELETVFNNVDPLILLFVAGSCGHFELFQHLYNKIFHETNDNIATSEISLSLLFSYILYFAAGRGHINVIQFILTKVTISNNNSDNNFDENTQLEQQHSEFQSRKGYKSVFNFFKTKITKSTTSTNVALTVNPQPIHFGPESLAILNITNELSTTKPNLIPAITTKAIHNASENGHLDIMKLLLPLPNDFPTLITANHTTITFNAARYVNVIKFLLSEIPGVNQQHIALSALKHASAMGVIDTVRFVLDTFPDISTYHPPYPFLSFGTAVGEASFNGHLEIAQLLLRHRGTVDVSSALVKACKAGHMDIVKVLMMVDGIRFEAGGKYAVTAAATAGHFDIVRLLMVQDGVDVSVEDNLVLRKAAEAGDLTLVKMLVGIGLPNVDPCACENEAFRLAASKGHEEVVRFLLGLPGVDPSANDNEAIRMAAAGGHLYVVSILLNVACGEVATRDTASLGPSEIIKVFVTGPGGGDDTSSKILVIAPGINPTACDNEAIRKASEFGYTEIVKMLVNVTGVDASACDNEAIRKAAENGHVEVVKILLKAPAVDPKACDNEALYMAAAGGHYDVVIALWLPSDAFIDPVTCNIVLCMAIGFGHFEIVKKMVTWPGMDPTTADNAAVRLAAESGNLEILKFLLTRRGVDITACDNEAIRTGVCLGEGDVVEFLVTVRGIDPAACDNEAIRTAAEEGYLEIVKVLVGVTGVDPTACDNEAVKKAAEKGHEEVVKFLLTLPGVALPKKVAFKLPSEE
ncbi:hypothetical protein HDU76_001207 [Blyttiomyces sp. JEL0837]|nr:hypothetical protein HDU76_001207 [Blyttiomyces sp. JEL0837]